MSGGLVHAPAERGKLTGLLGIDPRKLETDSGEDETQ